MATRDGDRVADLSTRIDKLESENAQLRGALASRIIIEQAKGVLIERLELPADDAFELMRGAARRTRMKIRDLAAEVLETRATPASIEREFQQLIRNRDRADGASH